MEPPVKKQPRPWLSLYRVFARGTVIPGYSVSPFVTRDIHNTNTREWQANVLDHGKDSRLERSNHQSFSFDCTRASTLKFHRQQCSDFYCARA